MGTLGSNSNGDITRVTTPRIEQDVNSVTGVVTTTRTTTTGKEITATRQLPTPDNPGPIDPGVFSTAPAKVDTGATGAKDPASEIDLLANAFQRLLGQGVALPDAGQPVVVPTSSQSSSSLPVIVTVIGIGVSIYLYYKRHHHESD